MKPTSFEIPEGCTRVTIEQQDNQIITTFEPEVKFKDGDVVLKRHGYAFVYIFVFSHVGEENCIFYHAYYSPTSRSTKTEKGFGIGAIGDKYEREIRHATELEKQQLFDELAKVGKVWNAEKKCIEELKPKRWRGDVGYVYYILNTVFEACRSTEENIEIDDERYNAGNYFQTKKKAEDFAEQIKQLLR